MTNDYSYIWVVLPSSPLEFSIENPQVPALRDVVQNFWQVDRCYGTSIRETIIPKGSLELIFKFDDCIIPAIIGERHYQVPRCFISGYNTVPIQLEISDRQVFFGVFVRPASLRKIFRINATEYANQCTDLTLIDPSMSALWHQLAEQKTFQQRVAIFTNWIVGRLPVTTRHEQLFDDFLTGTWSGSSSADELSRLLCYSPRHLSRKLHELTAMNLEQTLIYKRYLGAINLMHHSPLLLTDIAHRCGFSDQSHFTKTFRAYAHMKPTEYRALKSNVSGHIFENVR